ncbi:MULTISPECIES: hypothetical protein [unclassified Allomuricauda]|uniref:hypothetical protein n=1 Tax=unclassified Allomuricauda TaxID=2615049 RepID=UPI00273D4585|nr:MULTISPECIES: hypothetical protein [unclassified Allomuricauda]
MPFGILCIAKTDKYNSKTHSELYTQLRLFFISARKSRTSQYHSFAPQRMALFEELKGQ